jgi:hypothetical protein
MADRKEACNWLVYKEKAKHSSNKLKVECMSLKGDELAIIKELLTSIYKTCATNCPGSPESVEEDKTASTEQPSMPRIKELPQLEVHSTLLVRLGSMTS